jgi:hypothetical protein
VQRLQQDRTMKNSILRAPLRLALTTTALLPQLTGCDMPDGRSSESISTTSEAVVVERAHQELTDPQDGMFYSYWERNFTQGHASMDLQPLGYATTVDYTDTVIDDPNFVVGKGRKPCWGEQVNWQVAPNPVVKSIGVYGWQRAPLVEYYIGRDDGGGRIAGQYETSRGTYELQVLEKEQENVLNPTKDPALPLKFLQFNCRSLDGAERAVGPVELSEHFQAWEELMRHWWPTQTDLINLGYSWSPLSQADYCLVATEIYSKTTGHSSVSNIRFEERITVDVAQSVSELGTGNSSLTYKVVASEPWKILPASIPSWTTVSPTTGAAGLTLITVQVAANTTSNERRANFELHTTVSDALGFAQVIQFYAGEGWVPTAGGGGSLFQITPNGDWSAQSSAPEWLSVTPNHGTSGTYTLNTSASANTGTSSRSATVTVTGGTSKTFQVTQAPVSLVANPMLFTVAAAGATSSLNIYSNVNWWSAYTTNGSGWLTINPGSYSGVGNGMVSFTVAPNATGHDRSATITLAGGDVPTRAVTVIQPAGACDASNRLLNPGFESGTSGWTTWSGSLSTIPSPVRTGAASGRVTNRTASWQGPVQDLLGKVTAGRTYTARAWGKVSGSSSQPLGISLKTECVGSAPIYTPLNSATGNASTWTQLSGQFTAPSCPLVSLSLYVEGPSAGTTLYVDDASVTQVCP